MLKARNQESLPCARGGGTRSVTEGLATCANLPSWSTWGGGSQVLAEYLSVCRRNFPIPQNLCCINGKLSPRVAKEGMLCSHTLGWKNYPFLVKVLEGVWGNFFQEVPPQKPPPRQIVKKSACRRQRRRRDLGRSRQTPVWRRGSAPSRTRRRSDGGGGFCEGCRARNRGCTDT